MAVGLYHDWLLQVDVPVLAVFDMNGNPVDTDNDGLPGTAMIPGLFSGSSSTYTGTVVAIPPAIWLFGSGLLGLVSIAKRKKAY